jgi:hypothetical protein
MKSGRKRQSRKDVLSRLNTRFRNYERGREINDNQRYRLQKSLDYTSKYVPRNSLERERFLYKTNKIDFKNPEPSMTYESTPCNRSPIENYLEGINLRSILKDFKKPKKTDYKIQTINNIVINGGRVE